MNDSSKLSRRDFVRFGLYGAMAACSPALASTGCRNGVVDKKPNIILITVDTLRADHLGCYGYNRNTTPHIDQFARDSLLFENCFSHAPSTRLSFSSILSGYLPHETKISQNKAFLGNIHLLPEIVRRNGYTTIGVVSNYVIRKRYPTDAGFNKGFQIYDDRMDDRELVRKQPESVAKSTTARATELLKRYKNDKLFMWIHYQDPHGPYTPPEDYAGLFVDRKQKPRILKQNERLSGKGGIPSYQILGDNADFHHYVSMYDREIRYADDEIGLLMDTLKEFELYDDSLIVFSADHGECLGEHDFYFCHSENLYNSLLHVPLIIRYGQNLHGRRSEFVQHIDLMPTLLNVIGHEIDPGLRGFDLLEAREKKREIFSEMHMPRGWGGYIIAFSIIVDHLKLIYTPKDDFYRLYDIALDPDEKKNLMGFAEYETQLAYLKTRLHQLRTEDRLNLPRAKVRKRILSEEEERNLRSLGYLE